MMQSHKLRDICALPCIIVGKPNRQRRFVRPQLLGQRPRLQTFLKRRTRVAQRGHGLLPSLGKIGTGGMQGV